MAQIEAGNIRHGILNLDISICQLRQSFLFLQNYLPIKSKIEQREITLRNSKLVGKDQGKKRKIFQFREDQSI